MNQWDYIGDVLIGVVCACDCEGPNEVGPHEQHDVVKPVAEDDIPEGWMMEEWIAACHLIAAAPELLAACKEFIAVYDSMAPIRDANLVRQGKPPIGDPDWIIRARTAIKKAEAT